MNLVRSMSIAVASVALVASAVLTAGTASADYVYYEFKTDSGLCMDTGDHDVPPVGTILRGYECNRSNAQKFRTGYINDDYFRIIHKTTGLCVTANKDKVSLEKCSLKTDAKEQWDHQKDKTLKNGDLARLLKENGYNKPLTAEKKPSGITNDYRWNLNPIA
ncbi:RICIN domain-containing protein [Saccharothrix syringae]|uniref:Ricin B lectin domain-containing protein n=1 Tax=Saccharothrix syringae TaxID=103733 RepID=A0A5Q0H9Z0_SACSY|nr:RICIN domain-containing protein [Saccharothrix syringae]QFZ22620.1 hypothetical protein EKG83_38985 [Saccharothrix syringae]